MDTPSYTLVAQSWHSEYQIRKEMQKKNNFYFLCCKNHLLLLSGILWLSLSPVASAQTTEQGGFTTITYQEEQEEYGEYDLTSNVTLYQQDESTQMAISPEGYTTTNYQEQREEDDAENDHTTLSSNHEQDEYATNTVSMEGSTTDSYQEDEGPCGCICSQCVPQEQKHMQMDIFIKSFDLWIMCGLAVQCTVLMWLSFVLGVALHGARK
ncbi:uncharacterized protein [Macrobrachium rosenbergii]|uniref:uncharacterized protein isoform X2 n=1 Tax=Macrobrachium rosenbergii TaxID=79674 RepID=UPI0034D689F6